MAEPDLRHKLSRYYGYVVEKTKWALRACKESATLVWMIIGIVHEVERAFITEANMNRRDKFVNCHGQFESDRVRHLRELKDDDFPLVKNHPS